MKSALRRALAITDEIESFKFRGWPGDDPDGVYYSVNRLRELAIKLRSAAQGLDHPYLREAFERLQINIDGNDYDAGVALHAELQGIAGWLRDATEEWGDDPSRWQSPPVGKVNHSPANLEDKPLPTKERESLLKLVIGMAMAYHGYDPQAAKSEVPNLIVADLDKLGLSIDVGTVRKYLKQGLELVPPIPTNGHES
jgi:hypothetical protein